MKEIIETMPRIELALIIIGVFVLILGIILGYAMIHEYRMYLENHWKARYSFRDFIKRERFYIYLLLASIFIFLTNLLYYYLTTKNRLLVAILAFILPFSFAKAEVKEDGKTISQGWYVGIEGGMPFGFSTFSSFGHDKTHLGWAAGLYGGYRFNSIFSAELSAKYGEMNLSAQDCCVERKYWLESDGVRYNAGVLGMDSWEYANLKSHVRMGRYGARVNVHLLGLFHQTANSRWDLAVSPHIYAVTTKADIQTIADDAKVMKGSTNWHLGYGADLQVGYQLTSCLKLGIYSGLTRLTGERMDGMPEYQHKNNFLWESGIRLGINLPFANHHP